jgi:type I restriction enzyme, S subunit
MRSVKKMKDSGIPWIGQIPAEWEVRRIKTIFEVLGGATPSSGNPEYWDGDILWVTPADMPDGEMLLRTSKRKITKEGLSSCASELVPAGSVIVSNRAPIGKIALADTPLCTNQGCKSLVATEASDSKYYYYFLSTQDKTLNMLGQGTTFMELSNQSLKTFVVPCPGIAEQKRIAEYLDLRCGEIDRVIAAFIGDKCGGFDRGTVNQGLVAKLKEYRSSLIWEAVTGKVEV